MAKTYSDYMDEISPDELYDKLVAYGLFSEKLPPIFDGQDFLMFCKQKERNFENKNYKYVTFYSTRNTNMPRTIGIPTPMSHERLCFTLKRHWVKIQDHFKEKTSSDQYRISRIHLKKNPNSNSLFEMNYDKYNSVELNISMGKRYLVKTDISKCFPSIYTHAIPWALVTKEIAKANKKDSDKWYNQIDKSVQLTTDCQTHGLLIGPHTSNLISELILCAIDEELSRKWNYIRHIDDYECYVDTEDEANEFILDLNKKLHHYDLSINQGKTKIQKMPLIADDNWTLKIRGFLAETKINNDVFLDYKDVRTYINNCIELFQANGENATVFVYGFKCISDERLSYNARKYLLKTTISLAMLYPYLISSIDDSVFIPLSVDSGEIGEYLNLMYGRYLHEACFDAVSFVIQIALKYDIVINKFDADNIIETNDCILLLCGLIYSKKYNLSKSLKKFKNHAKKLKEAGDMDEYWIFIYECLGSGSLDKDWKNLKRQRISFLKNVYRY